MERRGGSPRRRDDRGAAAVEFALVVPILLLLFFGIISYGVMLSFRQSLSQAATEAARAAAVTFSRDLKHDEAAAAVNEALNSVRMGCQGGDLVRTRTSQAPEVVGACEITGPGACTPAAAEGVECVTITLRYDYADHPMLPSLPGVGLVLPDTVAYSAQARVS